MNGIKPYKLASPTWDENESDAIRYCAHNQHLSMGEKVFEFEQAFAKYVGSKFAVMVNSGSSANLLMTAALFYTSPKPLLKAKDEIIVPAISWPTTYYPLQQYGLKVKFVDINLYSLNYNLEALAEAVTDNTKAVMVVNLLGNPNDFDRINSIIAGKNIILLEDNCESLGALYKGKHTGTFGLMGTYSFFFSHHICTMEGGMVVTDDEHLHDILLCLRAHGWTRNLGQSNTLCQKSSDSFEESFRFLLPGYNLRPLEMSGAAGLEQLKKLPNFLESRRHNAKIFQSLFENSSNYIIQKPIGKPSWFGFSLVINPEAKISRRKVTKALLDNGIECRQIVSGNFAAKDVMRYFDYSIHGKLKNAEYVDSHGFFIGNDHIDHAKDLVRVHNILGELS